ncbi:thioredoxin family protein [Chitinophagaceae bacterium LWZ2-11]
MQKATIVCTLFICVFLFASFHPPKKKNDLWQQWNEILQLNAKEKKPILIDVYTTWCYYCKRMDATVYKNDSVSAYLKEKFYRFKLNAESKDTLEWNGKKYGFDKRYKVHEFMKDITQAIVFPSTVIIPPDGQPFSIGGQVDLKEMETLLKYFTCGYPGKDLTSFAQSIKTEWK